MPVTTKSRSSDAEPTFSVVTRMFDAELPYVGSFIRHYTNIGVRKFYFVNTHRAQFDEVKSYIARHEVQGVELKVLNTEDDNNPVNGMQNEALPHVEADFVINVDVDEYWVLPSSCPDLRTLVKRRRADVYNFGWLMLPSDKHTGAPKPPYYGFHGHQSKYMVRQSCIRRLGIHRPYLKGGGGKPAKQIFCGCAVHFWGRSFQDVLLKVVGQKIGNSKTSSKDQLLQLVDEGDIPNRLKLLAFFCRQPRVVPLKPKVNCKLLEIDVLKENELLERKLKRSEVASVHKAYQSFACRLRAPKVWASLPQYGTGISDLHAADALESIRAVPQRLVTIKRRELDDVTPVQAAKRSRIDSVNSDDSTAAESSPGDDSTSDRMSESERSL